MKRSVWGVVLSVLWLGCGGSSGLDASESGSASARNDAVTTRAEVFTTVIPPMPALPPLVDLDKTPMRRFYPEGVSSAFTIIYRDPADEKRFKAIGFDVREAKAHFYVTGTVETALDPMRRGLLVERMALEHDSPMTPADEHMVGKVGDPPGPVPGPGIHDLTKAWQIAAVSYFAEISYPTEVSSLTKK